MGNRIVSFLQLSISAVILVLVVLFITRDDKVNDNQKDITRFLMERMYLEDNVRESILNNNLRINLQMVPSDIPILMCCYSSQSCGGCVDFAIDKIKEEFVDFETNTQILFLASGFNEKRGFRERNTVNVGQEKLGLEIDNSMYVCYFILHKGQVTHLFIPEKNYSNYTDIYLKEIKKRYF